MKRILVGMVCMLLAVSGSFAKDYTPEQLEFRLGIVKFLAAEGCAPQIDKDGDVRFVKDGLTCYFIINETWKAPFLVVLHVQFGYDEEFTKKRMENCILVAARHKAIKLYCAESSYSLRADIICTDAGVVKEALRPLMQEIHSAMNDIALIFKSDLADNDIALKPHVVFSKAMGYYREEDYEKSFPLFSYLSGMKYKNAYGYMGLAYELGEGTDADKDKMISYYEEAIKKGDYWCAYRLGMYYYAEGDYGEAMNNLMRCGANDNGFRSDALYIMGKMYEEGTGVSKDMSQAILCYQKAVKYASVLECDARLALIRLGETVEQEDEFVEATKSMLMGLSAADMYQKGQEYEFGLNQRYVSLTKAFAYYKAAADEGYAKAEKKMGDIYINKFYPFKDAAKSDKYYKKALKNFKKLSKSDGEANYELGYMYQNGSGVEKDLEQAKYYYKLGVSLGDKNAAWRLGVIYKNEMEYIEAYQYLLKAAEQGQGMAMYEVAKLYENGLGAPYDMEKAIEWYHKCAEIMCAARRDAQNALKRLSDQ